MKKILICIVLFLFISIITYVNIKETCHKIIGVYSKVMIPANLLGDMINYENEWKKEMPGMNLDELRTMEIQKTEIEIKVLKKLEEISRKLEG